MVVCGNFVAGPLDNNVYVVADETSGDAAVIDPGLGSEPILGAVQDRGWRLTCVINTHGHFDHVACDAHFVGQTGAALLIHADDVPLLGAVPQQARWFGYAAPPVPAAGRLIRHGDEIGVGSAILQVIHTPGHTPGGVCLLAGAPAPGGGTPLLFSGDTLFAGSIGRTDLAGGDYQALLRSIRERLLPLSDDTLVYPGHGPATTIGREREGNPFLIPG